MNKLSEFLELTAYELHISKGEPEGIESWATRVVYSILGRMALASLWDLKEDECLVSIYSFKRRIETLLYAYKNLFSAVNNNLLIEPDDLSNEIYRIYEAAGFLYHSPKWISPVLTCKASAEGILFVRGLPSAESVCMSGLGTYQYNQGEKTESQTLQAMFHLPYLTLKEQWDYLVATARWQSFRSKECVEYLRLNPPFSYGYWMDKPDITGRTSLLRLGGQGMQIYYMYKYVDQICMVSQLADWQVVNGRYRNIAICLLLENGQLPAISYRNAGEIIFIQLSYLLPPEELNFLKLYSWPQSFRQFSCDFKRIMQRNVFGAFRHILEKTGYFFEEES